jgi:cell division septal protein FtsQ
VGAMASRLAFDLPRVPSMTLPRVPPPSRRALKIAAGLAGALVLAYAGARETSVFAVRAIEVPGASPTLAAEVRRALRDVEGESLVALDAGEVETTLRGLPSLSDARVDRSFPHALVVRVVPERPLALLRSGSEAWIVSAEGRVLRKVESRGSAKLPRIRLPDGASLRPGERVGKEAAAALSVVRAVPNDFPVRVLSADVREGEASLVVAGWVRVRLGEPVDLGRKLEAAAAVLGSLPPEELAAFAYLDASVPARVVGGHKPQPESES